jgi:hypothetical protein
MFPQETQNTATATECIHKIHLQTVSSFVCNWLLYVVNFYVPPLLSVLNQLHITHMISNPVLNVIRLCQKSYDINV